MGEVCTERFGALRLIGDLGSKLFGALRPVGSRGFANNGHCRSCSYGWRCVWGFDGFRHKALAASQIYIYILKRPIWVLWREGGLGGASKHFSSFVQGIPAQQAIGKLVFKTLVILC